MMITHKKNNKRFAKALLIAVFIIATESSWRLSFALSAINIKVELNKGNILYENPEDSIRGAILPTFSDISAFEQFLKEHWQIPSKWRDDTTTIVIQFKVLFDNDGKILKVIKGEPWKEMNYCLHNNNLKIIQDPEPIEDLSEIIGSAPSFRFRRNYQYQLGNRCRESSFCLLIKMNTISLHNYSWHYVSLHKE